jgi:LPXTG-motif cell wall-anchored protein
MRSRLAAALAAMVGLMAAGLVAVAAPAAATETQPEPSATVTAEPSATVTAEPSATVTAEPSATPTAAPTQTATPTTGPTQTATPKPQDCQAYLYTGTQENLCKDFPGDQGSVTCADVEYRVTLVNKSDDPWGLDGSGGNIGTVGVGCESNPLKPTGSAAPVPTLPVTGSSTTLWFALAGLAALGSGALLFVLARRRRVQFRA